MTEIDISIPTGRVRAIPVAATSSGGLLIAAADSLNGWSLADSPAASGFSAEGSVVAPAAGATIASLALLPGSLYVVKWEVQLIGAAAAADQDNFQLTGTASGNIPSLNAGAAGQYPQDEVEATVAPGGTVAVKAIGAGTVGVTYAAQLTVELAGTEASMATLTSGQDTLAEINIARNGVDTRWFGDMGVRVRSDITLNVTQGSVKGAVYAVWRDGSEYR